MTQPVDIEATGEAEAYTGYERWKGWDDFMQLSAYDRAYFGAECRGLSISDCQVLEIGFGAGKFLAFAKERGAHLAGTELNSVLVERAKEQDIAIVGPDFASIIQSHSGKLDTIAAFDVFEHPTPEGLAEGLDCLAACLKPGGKALLRFPNGQSPFGLAPQHGDPTHRLALSRSYLEAVMGERPLEVERYGDAARVAVGNPIKRLAVRFKFMLRDIVAGSLRRIYGNSIPYDPVVAIVLRRT